MYVFALRPQRGSARIGDLGLVLFRSRVVFAGRGGVSGFEQPGEKRGRAQSRSDAKEEVIVLRPRKLVLGKKAGFSLVG